MPVMQDAYAARIGRVDFLLPNRSHAASLLRFYRHLLTRQRTVYEAARENDAYLPGIVGLPHSEPPIRLHALDTSAFTHTFVEFTRAVARESTSILQVAATAVAGTTDATVTSLLRTYADHGCIEDIAATLDVEVDALAFFPRAFYQPIAEALATKCPPAAADLSSNTCPTCGSRPQATVLCDEPEAKGRRYLVCSACASWWRFPRSRCPHCGETASGKIEYHLPEDAAALRIETCTSCSRYVKGVDLRVDGRCHPLVDDVASVELDLWCRNRGFTKVYLNVLGL